MIDSILNQMVSSATRISSVDKGNSARQYPDSFKKMLQQEQNEHSRTETHTEIGKDKIEELVKGMNDFIQPVSTSIKFVLHEKLNDYYVTVVDDRTNEVIKEIPSKKLLDTYASMMEFVGLLIDKKI